MGKRVLIVEDDSDIRLFSRNVLEENGYESLEAENGEQGMEIVKKQKPDLLLLDVMMPKQSGIRLYRNIKTNKAFKNIPIIIMSGITKNAFLRSQKALTEFGGKKVPEPEGYLEKPVEPQVLSKAVKELIG